MLDICLFCEQGEELKAMLGSVDDIHGDIFKICYKLMECCRIQTSGFGLWIQDNPAEWLVKDQAFLLQGPLCHCEQRDAFRRRIILLTDSVTKQKIGKDNPWDNAGVVRL